MMSVCMKRAKKRPPTAVYTRPVALVSLELGLADWEVGGAVAGAWGRRRGLYKVLRSTWTCTCKVTPQHMQGNSTTMCVYV